MAERPVWEQIGTSFIQLYYQQFDNNREQLGALYVRISTVFFLQCKLKALPYSYITQNAKAHNPHETCLLFVKVDDDPVMGFHQLFVLKNINDKWVCSNDIFRLALYNYA
uniref:NTF2 domain-containing protein n=1 Tax=Anolis carolinensis TaxID=28377 RepID=A0A803TBR3_ANOCA